MTGLLYIISLFAIRNRSASEVVEAEPSFIFTSVGVGVGNNTEDDYGILGVHQLLKTEWADFLLEK
jgi:hypothetical protein